MKTNKNLMNGMAGLALAIGLQASAFATQVTIDWKNDVYRKNPATGGNEGGEFNVIAFDAGAAALLGNPVARGYVVDNGTTFGTANGTAMKVNAFGTGFETFCIEHNQGISRGGIYNASISLGAIPGGVAGGIDLPPIDGNTTDLISIGTAYLYSKFAKGTLAGYTYAHGLARADSANMLQDAIWYLEDEISFAAAGGAGNTFLAAVIAKFGAAGAKLDNDKFNVAALNLGPPPGFPKQDLLILNDNHFSVPDGGISIMLLGMGLTGLSMLRRKLV